MKRFFPNSKAYENAHIAFWLIKDFCWCRGFHTLGTLMIVPTLAMAIDITWSNRKNVDDLFHNSAMALWICANATWMLGEFHANDTYRPYATVFFIFGLALISYYYLFVFRKQSRSEHT